MISYPVFGDELALSTIGVFRDARCCEKSSEILMLTKMVIALKTAAFLCSLCKT